MYGADVFVMWIAFITEVPRAFPYVMENIELLFAAYFNLPEQADFRNNALKMFYFVRGQEAQIHKMLEE